MSTKYNLFSLDQCSIVFNIAVYWTVLYRHLIVKRNTSIIQLICENDVMTKGWKSDDIYCDLFITRLLSQIYSNVLFALSLRYNARIAKKNRRYFDVTFCYISCYLLRKRELRFIVANIYGCIHPVNLTMNLALVVILLLCIYYAFTINVSGKIS